MTVSILLATYQGAPFVKAQMESLLHQTYLDCHILVRDDGSNDGTKGVIAEYARHFPDKITLLEEQKNLGIKGNFSRLMELCPKTPYIAFCDQDDWWQPDKIEICAREMRRLEMIWGAHTPLLVHTDLVVVDQNLSMIAPSFWNYSYLSPTKNQLPRLLSQNVVTGCAMLINQALLEKAWPIPPEAWMHDWWIALVACCFGKIQALSIATILYRQHANNDTGARPYSLRWPSKKMCSLADTCRQGEQLLSRYTTNLTSSQRDLLSLYCHLPHKRGFSRRWILWKEGFWKQGWLRNIPHFLLSS